FFLLNKGLSILQIMNILAVYFITIVLLEIPSGAVADIIGRKKTYAFGMLIIGICVLSYIFVETYIGFIFIEMLYGLGFALQSGANTALIWDTLKNLKKEKDFKKIQGKAQGIGLITVTFTSLFAGWIYSININFPLILSSIFLFIGFFVALSFKEPNRYSEKIRLRETLSLTKESASFTINHKQLLWLILFSSAFLAFGRAIFWLFQKFFLDTGINIIYIGIIFSGATLIAAFSSILAHRIEKIMGRNLSFIIMFAFTFFALLFLSSGNIYFGISAIILTQFVLGYSNPIITDYINILSHSRNRATVLSVFSFSTNLMIGILLPFVGWLAEIYTLPQAFLMSASLFFAINILLLISRALRLKKKADK
ncbi:MAG: MFS transporter, partial [Candidatus Aenigmarchaeota archaeon]|nr:MFS transporter [Candidatus Aenigmarchaeota archaeon]